MQGRISTNGWSTAHNKKWSPLHLVCAAPAKFRNKIIQIRLDPTENISNIYINITQYSSTDNCFTKSKKKIFFYKLIFFVLMLGEPFFLQGTWGTCLHCLLDNPALRARIHFTWVGWSNKWRKIGSTLPCQNWDLNPIHIRLCYMHRVLQTNS